MKVNRDSRRLKGTRRDGMCWWRLRGLVTSHYRVSCMTDRQTHTLATC